MAAWKAIIDLTAFLNERNPDNQNEIVPYIDLLPIPDELKTELFGKIYEYGAEKYYLGYDAAKLEFATTN